MREVGPALEKGQVVLSIVAGATLRTLTTGLGHAALVRAMPNTPSQIRRGITVWTASSAWPDSASWPNQSCAPSAPKEVGDETFVAMATALSGTGPTYLFAVMEALIDAGVHMGFPRELAHDLVVETLIGSASTPRSRSCIPPSCGMRSPHRAEPAPRRSTSLRRGGCGPCCRTPCGPPIVVPRSSAMRWNARAGPSLQVARDPSTGSTVADSCRCRTTSVGDLPDSYQPPPIRVDSSMRTGSSPPWTTGCPSSMANR